MNTLRTADLKPGDVLLFHGNGFLSRFIRFFDGSQYSHAAIFDGKAVVEAEVEQGNGIRVDTVDVACSSAAYTHVYRFISKEGKRLGMDLPFEPVAENIKYFETNPEGYAYSQIFLLGILLATRKVPIVDVAVMLRHFLDEAAEKVNEWLNVGKKVIICSELVYKCFYGIKNEAYHLDVAGIDATAVSAGLAPRSTLMPGATPQSDIDHLMKDAAAFLATYRLVKPTMSLDKAGQENEIMAIPEFVTPRDLATSPNLMLIGQLVP